MSFSELIRIVCFNSRGHRLTSKKIQEYEIYWELIESWKCLPNENSSRTLFLNNVSAVSNQKTLKIVPSIFWQDVNTELEPLVQDNDQKHEHYSEQAFKIPVNFLVDTMGSSLSKILSMRFSPRNWHTSCGLMWTPCARWWSAPSLPPTQAIALGSELGSSFLEVAEHTLNVEIRGRREKEADIEGKGGLSFGVLKVGGMGTEATHAWWTPNAIAIANAGGNALCTLQSLLCC